MHQFHSAFCQAWSTSVRQHFPEGSVDAPEPFLPGPCGVHELWLAAQVKALFAVRKELLRKLLECLSQLPPPVSGRPNYRLHFEIRIRSHIYSSKSSVKKFLVELALLTATKLIAIRNGISPIEVEKWDLE